MKIESFEQYQQITKTIRNDITHMVTSDAPKKKCIIISGEPGIGKTFITEGILENQDHRDYVNASSVSPFGLYQLMWEHPDGAILLDDSDDILRNKGNGASTLKKSTEMKPVREVNWQTSNFKIIRVPTHLKDNKHIKQYISQMAENDTKYKNLLARGELFPNRFYFSGLLIILSNKTQKQIQNATDGALGNRAKHYELVFTLDGAIDLLKHAHDILTDIEPNVLKTAIDFLTSEEAIQYCRATKKLPTFRSINKVVDEVEAGNQLNENTLETCLEFPTFSED